jgi:hypothetical protein
MCLASTKVCWYHFIQAQNKPCYTDILLPNDPNSLTRKGKQKKVHAGSHKREKKKLK